MNLFQQGLWALAGFVVIDLIAAAIRVVWHRKVSEDTLAFLQLAPFRLAGKWYSLLVIPVIFVGMILSNTLYHSAGVDAFDCFFKGAFMRLFFGVVNVCTDVWRRRKARRLHEPHRS